MDDRSNWHHPQGATVAQWHQSPAFAHGCPSIEKFNTADQNRRLHSSITNHLTFFQSNFGLFAGAH